MLYSKLGLLALISVALLIIPTGCQEDRPERVDEVEQTTSPSQLSEWMEQLTAVVRATDKTGAETSRILAYASIAYYQGYSLSSENMRTLIGQLDGLDALPLPDSALTYNYGVIAEAAMSTVLLHHFDNSGANIKSIISSTYTDHERDYRFIGVTEPIIERSREFGNLMGATINDWSNTDGYADMVNCTANIPSGSEYWRPTPPSFFPPQFPCWGNLRAFTFTPSQLTTLCHPGQPMNVSTSSESEYMNDISELIQYNSNLNPATEESALFWNDGLGSITVPGHYITILQQLIDQNLLDGNQTVTAWTQLCISMADTYISTYKLKYTYNRPRPLSYIQENIETNWESLAVNPSTPEYPSLHATLAYSATQVFINLYGDISFIDNTHSSTGFDARSYSSFTEMAEEAVYSRLYAGTNLRSTLDASEYHGRCIAQRANELFFNE